MHVVNSAIEEYLTNLGRGDDPVLQKMEALAEELSFPIVGPQVGRVLYLITKLKEARTIFEMGSGFGYSAWWFARALEADGKVYWTDRSSKNLQLAKEFLTKAGLSQKIVFHCGDALEAFKNLKEDVDILFIDMDKESYPLGYSLFKERCRKGSILMADNMLWDGRVLKKSQEESTRGIQEFTRLVFNDKELASTIFPIRDGVLLSVVV